MNSSRISIFCLLIASVPITACQPCGKNGGHYDRKLTKRDLRAGPDQHQKHKQDLWEMVKAKKDMQTQKSSSSGKLAVCHEAYAKLLAQAIATQATDEHAQCTAHPIRCDHPLMAAALFTLLFIAPCAGNFYQPMFSFSLGVNHPDYSDCDDCEYEQRYVDAHRPSLAAYREFANKYNLNVNFRGFDCCPKDYHWCYPKAHCAQGVQVCDNAILEFHQDIGKLYAAIDERNQRAVEQKNLIDEQNKQALDQFREKSRKIRKSCIDLRDEILYGKTRQELIKLWNLETKLRNGDYGESGRKLIEGLQFPSDIVMFCPPVEENIDDLALTRRSQASTKEGTQFATESERTRQILQHRIDSQKIREKCIALKAKIEKIMPQIIALRNLENQLRNGDYGDRGKKAIGEIHFPDDVPMVCPPADENLDDQQLTAEAQESIDKGEKFLPECEQTRQEIIERWTAAKQPQPDQNLQIVTS